MWGLLLLQLLPLVLALLSKSQQAETTWVVLQRNLSSAVVLVCWQHLHQCTGLSILYFCLQLLTLYKNHRSAIVKIPWRIVPSWHLYSKTAFLFRKIEWGHCFHLLSGRAVRGLNRADCHSSADKAQALQFLIVLFCQLVQYSIIAFIIVIINAQTMLWALKSYVIH